MKVAKLIVGPIQANCYFISKPNTETLIVDPGAEGDRIKSFISEHGLNPQAILLTHAHPDHMGAVEEIREEYNLDVWLHITEADWFINAQTQLPKTKTHYWDQMGAHHVKGFSFQVQHLPGHSPGSVVYIFEDEGFVISGDTLFGGTVGRSDLEGGDHTLLISGIKRYITPLDPGITIFGGHSEPTKLEDEIKRNPFLNGASS